MAGGQKSEVGGQKSVAVIVIGGRGKGKYQVIPGRTITKGCLSQEVVGRVLSRVQNQAKYCYEKELTRNPNLAGKVTTFFMIGPTGAVTSSKIQQSTMGDAGVEDCLLKVIVWLKDQRQQEEFDRIYRSYFTGTATLPARTRMQAGRTPLDCGLEVEAIGYVPD